MTILTFVLKYYLLFSKIFLFKNICIKESYQLIRYMNELQKLANKQHYSWVFTLNRDPDSKKDKYIPNKESREVKSGHYVNVLPTPLIDPYLVTFSIDMANNLGLSNITCNSKEFLSLFSGQTNIHQIGKYSWATPYALSIYGQEMYDNCPFKNGNGYGDGRAISLTEVIVNDKRWELQLKGAGKTPFCRGADGRAVLRSCIREFLASEAMYYLGVQTTRALSVIASKTEKVQRQWYSNDGNNIIKNSICAMLCRTASSFIRIGHIELYGRRVKKSNYSSDFSDSDNGLRMNELKLMVQHAIFREYPHLNKISDDQERYIKFLYEVGMKLADLTADWSRVGFNQGNFNSDNCHISGQTLDYGPFGFIEQYNPNWNMWVGGGQHFSFGNQHIAGNKNFGSLVDAILPLLDEKHARIATSLTHIQLQKSIDALNLVWAKKLGFQDFDEHLSSPIKALINELLELMEQCKVDFTIFWRQLAEIVANLSLYESNQFTLNNEDSFDYAKLFKHLQNCFYKNISTNDSYKWIQWMIKWLSLLNHSQDYNIDYNVISDEMKKISPKFIPREWMLKDAYERAETGDYTIVDELQTLFKTPYDEHCGEHYGEMTDKYYKKLSTNVNSCVGITSMSCSS